MWFTVIWQLIVNEEVQATYATMLQPAQYGHIGLPETEESWAEMAHSEVFDVAPATEDSVDVLYVFRHEEFTPYMAQVPTTFIKRHD